VRLAFWALGLGCAAFLAYTTRHHINGDAIAYFDMAEAFRVGAWPGLINLTYSPGYAILLGSLEKLLPWIDELYLAKGLNFLAFIATMAACDRLVSSIIPQSIETEGISPSPVPGVRVGAGLKPASTDSRPLAGEERTGKDKERPEWGAAFFPILSAVCYSAFLVASLVWVRLQVVAPDMLVFLMLLLGVSALLRIKSRPDDFGGFAWLGVIAGLGYVTKTFLLPFSVVFFLLALACSRSLKRAGALVLVGAAIMAAIAAPLIWAQSFKAGRFSYGEAGNYNYAYFVAGRGERVHIPRRIHDDPPVMIYDATAINTYPPGTDPAYWHLGIRPTIDFKSQLSRFLSNVKDMLGGTALPVAAVLLWFCSQLFKAPISPIRIRPPSVSVMLGVISLLGIGMYCLIIMELRYVAPFIFLGFVALVCLLDYNGVTFRARDRAILASWLLVAFLVGTVVYSCVDQSFRALASSPPKQSHRQTFMEAQAVKDWLVDHGVSRGEAVAVFYPPHDTLRWARLAGVRVIAEVRDTRAFAEEPAENRINTLDALRSEGIGAVVTKRPFAEKLSDEGWNRVDGTKDYYVKLLKNRAP